MGLLKTVYELFYITWRLGTCLSLSFYDYLLQYIYPLNPLGKSLTWFLSAKNLSYILKKTIIKVEINSIHGNRLENSDLVAGLGRGTSFCWLQATDQENHLINLFIKIPANDYFKSLFLTMFGVYQNELNFYENINRLNCVPNDLYPHVYYAEMKRTKFVLVLEDILAKNVDFPTILDSCTYERAAFVIKTLARLHAANWGHPPDSIWSSSNRPLFCSVIALETLKVIQKRYASNPLISPDLEKAYLLFVENYEKVRQHWSAEVLTLIHGDTHIGNMHFYTNSSVQKMGFHDWQCVAQEHGMRDVGYFILSSLDSEALEANNCKLERDLLELYISELNSHLIASKNSSPLLTYAEVWRLYRELSWWTLTAFVISAGAGDLMPDPMIRATLLRINRGMKRINAIESLDQILK